MHCDYLPQLCRILGFVVHLVFVTKIILLGTYNEMVFPFLAHRIQLCPPVSNVKPVRDSFPDWQGFFTPLRQPGIDNDTAHFQARFWFAPVIWFPSCHPYLEGVPLSIIWERTRRPGIYIATPRGFKIELCIIFVLEKKIALSMFSISYLILFNWFVMIIFYGLRINKKHVRFSILYNLFTITFWLWYTLTNWQS